MAKVFEKQLFVDNLIQKGLRSLIRVR